MFRDERAKPALKESWSEYPYGSVATFHTVHAYGPLIAGSAFRLSHSRMQMRASSMKSGLGQKASPRTFAAMTARPVRRGVVQVHIMFTRIAGHLRRLPDSQPAYPTAPRVMGKVLLRKPHAAAESRLACC